MKKIIRFGVFETNSSTTHTLTIVSREDFEAWKNGELIFDECIREFRKTRKECHYPLTYEHWYDYDDGLELFEKTYTIKGVEIVAFGKFGDTR